MQIIEFKVGDLVTYRPYEKSINAVVKSVEVDEREVNKILYELSGNKIPVKCFSWPSNILESRYFEQYDS